MEVPPVRAMGAFRRFCAFWEAVCWSGAVPGQFAGLRTGFGVDDAVWFPALKQWGNPVESVHQTGSNHTRFRRFSESCAILSAYPPGVFVEMSEI